MKQKWIIVVLALCGVSPAVYAQPFPNKPIELVVSSSRAAAWIWSFG